MKDKLPLVLFMLTGVFIGLIFSFSFIVSVIFGIILGLSIELGLKLSKEKSIQKEEEPKIDPLAIYEDKLFNINYALRSTESVSKEVIEKTEKIIDKVLKLLPVLNTKDNYSELTVTVNRIPLKYLPSLIDPYLNLSEEERVSIESKLLKNLQDLNRELDTIQEAVDQGHKDTYQRMSILIDNLFEKENI